MYDTRKVVYQTIGLSAQELEDGYWWAYKEFYKWNNIFKASIQHQSHIHKLKHFFYAGGWKKFEPVWNLLIKTKSLNNTLPALETVLSKIKFGNKEGKTTGTLPLYLPEG